MSASSEIIGTNRTTRISPGSDHLHDVALGGHKCVPVHEQIHLDDLDCIFAWERFADEDVDLPLDEIVHDQLFTSELFIEVEHIGDVAVWILQRHHPVLRAGSGSGGEAVDNVFSAEARGNVLTEAVGRFVSGGGVAASGRRRDGVGRTGGGGGTTAYFAETE